MVAAIKFGLGENSPAVSVEVAPHMGTILGMLGYNHEEKMKRLCVRERALATIKYVAATNPAALRDSVSQALPSLYQELLPKKEYIKEVMINTNKIEIDDARQARKDAWEILLFLLKAFTEKVDIVHVVRVSLLEGLKDVYDIRIICHQIIAFLATTTPSSLLESSDGLISVLMPNAKLDPASFKRIEESDRDEEIKAAACATFALLLKCPNATSFPHLQDVLAEKDKDVGTRVKAFLPKD
eukprot:TRINITY_DN14304_c0_g1_i1.p1 TRINITY_DN14304_c0_g1~~TRINITY_DN14304_c0_g1_i1.p1  ORF type:complete len:267 (-),score=97.55 TRINITY_DN14304_c0_g1_i1:156-878(-)